VGRARGDVRENYSAPGIIFGLLVIVLMIGFRWHVGSDWGAYYMMYQLAGHVSFSGLTDLGDPGYMLLNGVAQSLGADIWLVNLFCGAVFTWGLYQLARIQPDPWLALL